MTEPVQHRRIASRRRAFTILELMIVIVIIGVLGGIVGLNLIGAADRAKADTTRASMKVVKSALTTYRVSKNAYPDTAQGFAALISDGLLTEVPKDGWGNNMGYRSPVEGHAYVIISAGKDGQPDTGDDIKMFPDTNE